MIASVEASLRRLKTDRIDLYWAHWPDDVTGSEEIVRGFEDLACAGKIIYAGLSHPNSASALIRSPSPGLDRTAPSP
ncbi:General stress protein 69 [compost metagenome]